MRSVCPLPWILLAMAATLAACRGTVLKPTVADGLREQVQSLEIEVDRLSLRNRELEAALAEASADAPGRPIDGEAAAAEPHLARIVIGAASAIRTDGAASSAPIPGMLKVYLEPIDGRGRFMQVTGRVLIQASMPVAGGEPIRLGERLFSPIEVRDAWRSGFMGSHYTFEVPVELPSNTPRADGRALEASVLTIFRDAIGGGEYSRLVTVPVDLRSSKGSEALQ